MSNELPGEWGKQLGPKGVHSYRDVERKVGISKGTAHRLMTGGKTSVDTVNKVADVLFDGDRDLVWALRGESLKDYGDWSLPAEASLLDPDQRDAVRTLIQVMVPKHGTSLAPAVVSEIASEMVNELDEILEPTPLRAVATDPSGESATSAAEADEQARKASEEQRKNIAEMERKKAAKGTDSDGGG